MPDEDRDKRRARAEHGWIGEPQPKREWHTPGWLSEKGGPSHFHSGISSESVDGNNALRD